MYFKVCSFKTVLFLYLFLIQSFSSISQSASPETPYNVNIFPPSPNSASIAKFGEIPVGYYTGIPSVDIPFYTIKTGDFTLPVSLSYHAGGYKVGEMASNVGLGWALQSAGVITRTVRGLADEAIGGYLTNSAEIESFMSLTLEDQLELYRQVNGELIDLQADLYSFNFMGKSGKFRWDKTTNKGVLLNNNENLQIEFISENKITITDSRGSKYYFGNHENNVALERSRVTQNGRVNLPSIEFPSSWFLVKAEDAKGKSIRFEYQTYTTRYCNTNHETIYSLKSGSYVGTCAISNEYNTDSYVIFGSKIKSIIWDDGKIEYVYSSSNRTDLNTTDNSLEKIEVWSDNNQTNFKYSWKLFYDYYSLSNGQSDPCSVGYSGPLRLLKVQQFSNTGNYLPPYEFIYNNLIPGRSTKAVDHWGFYNGATTNNSLIPELAVNNNGTIILLPGANRQPNLPSGMAGILTSIKYPTGGTTEFDYESHTAFTTSFPNEPSVEVENIQYAIVSKSDLGTLPIKKVPFTVQALSVLNGIQGAWVDIGVMVDMPCDPSVREGGCEGEIYINPVTGTSGTTWNFGGNGSVSGYISNKVFLKAGSYELVMRSFGDPANIKYLYATVFGPDPDLIDESLKFNRKIGGVRIRSIINKIGTAVISKRQYYYHKKEDTSISSGVLVDQPIYLSEFRKNQGFEVGVPLICVWYARHANSRIPLGQTQGSHIGYGFVVEDEVDPQTNLLNGRTTYEYTTANDWPDIGNLSLPYAPRTSFDMRRGKLKEKSQFKGVNKNEFQLIKKVSYEYLPTQNQTSNYFPNIHFACAQIDELGNCEQIAADVYEDLSLWTWNSKEITVDQVTEQNQLQQESIFEYGNFLHKLPTSIRRNNSKGEVQTTLFKYPLDFVDSDLDLVSKRMKNELNMNSFPLQITSKIEKDNGSFITSDQVFKYGTISNSKVGVVESFKLNIGAPLIENSFGIYKPITGVGSSYNTEIGISYGANNVIQEFKQVAGTTSAIWNDNGEIPIAKILNASIGDVAFTSFEFESDGRWSIPDISRNTTFAFSGNKSYMLTGNNNISRNGLSTGLSYIVSYWTMSGSALVNGTTGSQILLVGDWKLWRHVVNSVNQIVVSGSNLLIDELRLYPVGSQMSTYAYEPLVGLISEVDANDKLQTYEYDGFGRLVLVRDMYKNVIKKYCYNYFGEINICSTDPQWVGTGESRCKPCPSNGAYTSSIRQIEEKDLNPNSVTYNTVRWIDDGVSSSCVVVADWQNTTTAIRCRKNGSNQNTGEQEREQRDMNPCSNTYNQLRWTVVGTNTTACPISTTVQLTSNNTVPGATFNVQYYNVNTGMQYSFSPSYGFNLPLGSIPAGTYDITFGTSDLNYSYYYSLGCGYYGNGTTYTFFNIVIDNTCSTLSISSFF